MVILIMQLLALLFWVAVGYTLYYFAVQKPRKEKAEQAAAQQRQRAHIANERQSFEPQPERNRERQEPPMDVEALEKCRQSIDTVVKIFKAQAEILRNPEFGGPGNFTVKVVANKLMEKTYGDKLIITCSMYDFGDHELLLRIVQNRYSALRLTKESFEAHGLSKESAETLFEWETRFTEGTTEQILITTEVPFFWTSEDCGIRLGMLESRLQEQFPSATVRCTPSAFYFSLN